jgi:hypothetical protein
MPLVKGRSAADELFVVLVATAPSPESLGPLSFFYRFVPYLALPLFFHSSLVHY